jgi:hypothetical protein
MLTLGSAGTSLESTTYCLLHSTLFALIPQPRVSLPSHIFTANASVRVWALRLRIDVTDFETSPYPTVHVAYQLHVPWLPEKRYLPYVLRETGYTSPLSL